MLDYFLSLINPAKITEILEKAASDVPAAANGGPNHALQTSTSFCENVHKRRDHES